MAMCKASSSVHFISHSMTSVREGSSQAGWVPNTDMYTTDAGLVIKVELAGMRSDSLEITVEGTRLRVSGNRPDGCRAAKCSFLMMEINYGPFETTLDVPPAYDLSQAKAAYLNGFLRIDVPLIQRPSKVGRLHVTEGDSTQ